MADLHVISGNGRGTWQVAMHFDVPDKTNTVSVSYRTALVNSGLASVSVLQDGDGTDGTINAAETADLAAGIKFEHVVSIFLDGPGQGASSRLALLRAKYAELESLVIVRLKDRLEFFGFTTTRV